MLKRFIPILIATLLLAGCGEEPTVQRYEVTKPAGFNWPTSERREDGVEVDEIEWVWDVPEGWMDAPEIPEMLLADYRFKGTTPSLPGRTTVAKFDGDAGGVEGNIARWLKQIFVTVANKPGPKDNVTGPIRSPTNIGFVTLVDLHGQYQGEHMPTRIYAAILQIPAEDGSVRQTWVFKLAGDVQTVQANRQGLVQMALTFRPKGIARPNFPGLDQDDEQDDEVPSLQPTETP